MMKYKFNYYNGSTLAMESNFLYNLASFTAFLGRSSINVVLVTAFHTCDLCLQISYREQLGRNYAISNNKKIGLFTVSFFKDSLHVLKNFHLLSIYRWFSQRYFSV